MAVYPGYKGIAILDGVGKVRFESADISAKQEIMAPDLVMGDWDRDAYVYGPITIDGNISGPLTETFVGTTGGIDTVWGWAVKRSGCGTLTERALRLMYYCTSNGTADDGSLYNSQNFENLLANSLNISCSAGDYARFSLGVIGATIGDTGADSWETVDGTTAGYTNLTAEKLITWDKVRVAVTNSSTDSPETGEDAIAESDIGFQDFSIDISNNVEAVYAIKNSDQNLLPFALVPGIRQISGSLTVYNTPAVLGAATWDEYEAANVNTLQITLGDFTFSVFVRFHRVQPTSQVGTITSTIGFTGVTSQAAFLDT